MILCTITNSRADIYGNRYWFFTWDDTETGLVIEAQNRGDNAGHIYREFDLKPGTEYREFRQELPIREFKRKVKNMPYAGCAPSDLADYIRRQNPRT